MGSVGFPGYDFVIQGGTGSPQGITLGQALFAGLAERVIGAMDDGGAAYEIAPLFRETAACSTSRS
jgi:hypothetical protein